MQLDGMTMQAVHIVLVNAPHLPLAVQHTHIFPSMRNKVFPSLGQFCDNGYKVQLTSTTINTTHQRDDTLSFAGTYDTSNGMWMITISPHALRQPHTPASPPTPLSNNIYGLN